MFYGNYSNMHKHTTNLSDILLKGLWIPIVIFACLAVSFPFRSFPYEELVLMVLLAIIVSVLLFVSVKTFCDRPNNNNQIEQTIE